MACHDEKEELLSIGRLSKMANVSTDTLRYYDDIGLLAPAYISAETGYRYYSATQVETIAQILELKAYGFSLCDIKTILLEGDTLELYQGRYWALLREKEKLQKTIDRLLEKIRRRCDDVQEDSVGR